MTEPIPSVAPVLETDRLELCPFADADVEELHELFIGDRMRYYLLDDEVVAQDWVEDEVRASSGRFAQPDSCGLWAIRERPDSRVVGFVGFRPFFDPPELQLVYGLRPDAWGRGIATEAAAKAVAYAFDSLGFDEVRAATDVPNVASIAVLHRVGFTEVRRTDEGEHGTVFFRVEAEG